MTNVFANQNMKFLKSSMADAKDIFKLIRDEGTGMGDSFLILTDL